MHIYIYIYYIYAVSWEIELYHRHCMYAVQVYIYTVKYVLVRDTGYILSIYI